MNEYTILILVDWSNVKRIRVSDIIGTVLSKLEPIGSCIKGRCIIRLYGGWDEEGIRSKHAQELIRTQLANWDLVQMNVRSCQESGEISIPVTISKPELADCLLSDSTHRFERTYRRKRPSSSGNIRVVKPDDIGCINPLQDCFLEKVRKFFENPSIGCVACSQNSGVNVENKPLCYRNEQKMVDTMLSCDTIYAADFSDLYNCIVIVSEDDDFLPVFRQVIATNKRVRLIRATRPSILRSKLSWGKLEEIEV